ncbi:MAG: sulfite exporter TauE/SafE family protein [Candidatus Hadarchaeales archaeon]
MILSAAGFLIATVFSMVGLAGGSFIVPLLVLGFGLATQKAVGVSLFAVTFITISAALGYAARRRIDFRVGLILDALDVPGAFIGAYITTMVRSSILAGMFGLMLVFISFYAFLRKNSKPEKGGGGRPELNRRVITACMMGSFLSGIVSGMFGIGGGVVDELVMIFILGMSVHLSAATAMFGMALTTVSAVVPHWMLGNVVLEYAIPLAAGGVVGGQLGPYLSVRSRATTLRKVMAIVIALIGVRMLFVPFF